MADKSTQLVLEGLSRAVTDPNGAPLHGNKAAAGLFATNAAGKLAAQRCKDEGYLHVVGAETRGKTTLEICAITDKGAETLAGIEQLQVLSLNLTDVGDEGLKELAKLKNLRTLSLLRTRVTDKGLGYLTAALKTSPSALGELRVGPEGVTEKGLLPLVRARPFLNLIR